MKPTPSLHLRAILTMVLAMACLSTQDTLAKVLMLSVGPALIIWTRYALQTGLIGLSLVRRGQPQLLRTRHWGLHLLRGGLVVGGSVVGYGALQRMPVAEFTAIYCLVPLLVTLVGRYVFKERVSAWGWLCVALGLSGALLVVRPGGQVDALGAALALTGVACYTGFQTLTGVLARHDSPLTIQLYTSVLGLVSLSLALPFLWPQAALSGPELALLLAVGTAGAYGQFFMVLAFSRAPASVLSPYLYCAIVFSTLGGWLVFGHFPDALAVCGMMLIAVSGLFTGYLQRRPAPQPKRG